MAEQVVKIRSAAQATESSAPAATLSNHQRNPGMPLRPEWFEAARVKRQFRGSGMPLKVPSVEMIEIGAGGGSIALGVRGDSSCRAAAGRRRGARSVASDAHRQRNA